MGPALRDLFSGLKGAFRWWVIVAPWEQALRIRGGKTAKLLNAGVHFRIPLWDRIYLQPTRLRVTECPSQTLTTEDGHVLVLQAFLTFRVGDLLLLYDNLHEPQSTAKGFLMGAISELVQNNTMEDVTPSEVRAKAGAVVQERLQKLGLTDVEVSLSNFAYVPKAYRLVTGGVDGYLDGGFMNMEEEGKSA